MTHSTLFWITVANVLYLASYSVHDILWLRVLSVVAMLLLTKYYLMQPTPLMVPVWWTVVFIAINGYWIVRLIVERRPVHFTPDEARLKEVAFPSLTAREARNLFALGTWDDLAPGTSVVRHDEETKGVSVIAHGIADVVHRGVKVNELGEGQFVGGIDRNAAKLEMDVVVREAMRVLCWPPTRIDAFLAKRPDADVALERSIGFELRRTLNKALSELA